MVKNWAPTGAVHVPLTVCVPGPEAVAAGMLMLVLNEIIVPAWYCTFLAKRRLNLIFAESVVDPGLMKCMLRTSCVFAAIAIPTPGGMFSVMTCPGVELA